MEEVNQTGTSVEDVAAKLANRWSQPEVTEEKEEIAAEPIKKEAPVVKDEPIETDEAVEAESEQTDEPETVAEETSFQTITELAEALEVDPDEFLGTIKGKVKINGQEEEVSLAEAFKGYQMEADYRRKTSEVAEERREIEKARDQIEQERQQWQTKVSDVDAMSNIALNALTAEYNSVDWNNLKAENPTEFLVKQQEYNARLGQINQVKEALAKQAAEMRERQLNELLPKEITAMKRAIPEWDDKEAMEAGLAEVTHYLTDAGYKPEELSNLYDHKSVVIARKAMLYDKANSKPEPVSEKKTVKTVTKILKGGTRKQPTTVKQEQIEKARKRLKRTGKPDDAAAALLARWNS